MNQRRDATILRSGYISEGEQLMYARKGAVGDILGYFLNAEGNASRSWRSTKNCWASRSMNWRSCPPLSAWPEEADAIYAALKVAVLMAGDGRDDSPRGAGSGRIRAALR